ncbi:hypothetical protein WMF18_30370 [Sorangium sp. So ce315]|uniref:hypothetical protein n=1 Tax=Sorangium sp. So ce315 TaxID=3133299 RepID=UPI003F61519D
MLAAVAAIALAASLEVLAVSLAAVAAVALAALLAAVAAIALAASLAAVAAVALAAALAAAAPPAHSRRAQPPSQDTCHETATGKNRVRVKFVTTSRCTCAN